MWFLRYRLYTNLCKPYMIIHFCFKLSPCPPSLNYLRKVKNLLCRSTTYKLQRIIRHQVRKKQKQEEPWKLIFKRVAFKKTWKKCHVVFHFFYYFITVICLSLYMIQSLMLCRILLSQFCIFKMERLGILIFLLD